MITNVTQRNDERIPWIKRNIGYSKVWIRTLYTIRVHVSVHCRVTLDSSFLCARSNVELKSNRYSDSCWLAL